MTADVSELISPLGASLATMRSAGRLSSVLAPLILPIGPPRRDFTNSLAKEPSAAKRFNRKSLLEDRTKVVGTGAAVRPTKRLIFMYPTGCARHAEQDRRLLVMHKRDCGLAKDRGEDVRFKEMSDMQTDRAPVLRSPALVLIVEDEPALCALAGDVAEAAGLEFLLANDADEAIGLLETRPDIGVLFTDIHLHGSMDGLALVEIVRQRWPGIELLITSGKVIPYRDRLPAGSLYFAKPYDVEKVVAALQAFTRGRQGVP